MLSLYYFALLFGHLFKDKNIKKSLLDTKEVVQQKLELEYKNCFAVTNNKFEEVVILDHYVSNYFCKFWSYDNDLDQFIVHYFGQMVNNNENWDIAIIFLIIRFC